MPEPDGSVASISALEHGVEGRSADLCERADLGLRHAGGNCLFRESGDLLALLRPAERREVTAARMEAQDAQHAAGQARAAHARLLWATRAEA